MVERQVELPVAPPAAGAAVTEAEWLETWLADEAELDLRPGGEARFVVDGEARSGWVEEVSPPVAGGRGTLVFWWQGDGEPASRVHIELSETDGGTRLRVVEARPLELPDLVGAILARSPGGGGPVLVAV